MDDLKIEFEEALVNYDKSKASFLAGKFINENNSDDFVNEIVVKVLSNIGEKWDKGTYALSQVYLSSKVCEEIIDKLFPEHISNSKKIKKIGIVTLADHHILGKRIVSSALRSSGFNIVDYGHGISVEEMLDIVIKEKPDILLISVLMYPSALKIRELRDELNKKDINIKILVGGAPFNFDEDLWKNVGADEMGKNASEAISILEKWMVV